MSATVQSRHPLLHYHPRPQGSVSELVSEPELAVATQQVLGLELESAMDSELASEPELAVATQQVPELGMELELGLGLDSELALESVSEWVLVLAPAQALELE